MLEKVDLTQKLSKKVYKDRRRALDERLCCLQQACQKAGIPAIVVIEGWDASGKGDVVNRLSRPLDPAGFKFHTIQAPSAHEALMPWLWRFWIKIPRYGDIAVFDGSWYRRVLTGRVEGLIPPEKWRKAYRDIINFERTLANDGYVIVKFFLHISKKKQRKRFKKLEKHPLKSWRVQPEDWERHQKYSKYYQAVEDMLERTHTEWGPWNVVGANDRRWARVTVLETLARRLEVPLEKAGFFPFEKSGVEPCLEDEDITHVARYETRTQAELSLA